MTSSFGRRLRPTSAPPLDDDNLLDEILLRLPPDPSSLPRASAVCTRWRRVVSDPGFVGRFRLRHRLRAPILGCFTTDLRRGAVSFVPTLEAPNRLPADHFSLQLGDRSGFRILSCRHGLLLMFLPSRSKVLVWDPVAREQHRLDIPPGFDTNKEIGGAVLRAAAGDIRHFQVVLAGRDKQNILACVYSSEAGVWSELISTPLPNPFGYEFMGVHPVLVGDSLHWFINCGLHKILGFDLHRQILTVIPGPLDEFPVGISQILVMRADDGGLGVLFKSGCNVQLWKRKIDHCDGEAEAEASWVLGRTFDLDTLFSMNSEDIKYMVILGLAEYNSTVFVQTVVGHFMLQLESLQFNKTFQTNIWNFHQPFENVYTGETSTGGGHNGAELLHNT